jgi:hypothetical protein
MCNNCYTARILEPEKQSLIGNSCVTRNNTRAIGKQHAHATMEGLLETVISIRFAPRLHKESIIQNHENEHVRSMGQGEARRMKYKRLKLGSGQAYDRSSD